MSVNTVLILMSLVTCVVSVTTFFIGRKSASQEQGKESGVVLTELEYIKLGMDDIRKKQEKEGTQISELLSSVAVIEARIDSCKVCKANAP